VTGTLFFVPTVDFLDDLPDSRGASAVVEGDRTADVRPQPDGCLGIGDLKRSSSDEQPAS